MKITSDYLRQRDACEDQLAIFEAEWPDGAELTPENLLRAADLGLSTDWLVPYVLSSLELNRFYAAIRPARLRYYVNTRNAVKAYENCAEGVTGAYQTYQKASAPFRRAFSKAAAHALIESLEEEAT